MRIIAGIHRGRALTAVGKGDAGAHLRPTTDRVRESLFNVLSGGRFDVEIEGARVLDIFAGTGALGFEALSRGAAHVTFVENGRVGQRLIQANGKLLGAEGAMTLLRVDAARLPTCPGNRADLVFLDPPYGKGLGEKAMAAAMAQGWIAPGALIVWEESAEIEVPDGLELLDQRKYGDSRINFLEYLG
ncbi:16S rRNA (guanine(966)-N(2))-methyltransferase RsmD [Halocynthiibacter styelae]|uniref:16S rRNA (Guanine(966)-N(2))-methyltransferase RsmD n=1 Tax=Halocynthiibacter styelae TaxID=2761955 RepID=A0A8J7IE55_9RHOB|nr:16S rRNA (guanine(966)-N(2))-methyltransferase RsmD [Paenihalocynthiibacter styelae]MBI1495178.1 16S rRNA (guanine(966)-N(2))-methyltransferase RsmD [Paenihalocynthiibacter styelae]